MKVYLLTLLNSNFEEWHDKFPDKDINEFPFSVDNMSKSGALFDKDKLHNICKNELSKLSEDEVYDFLYDWACGNEPEKCKVWFADKEKMLAILRLYMGVGMKRRRKDLVYARQMSLRQIRLRLMKCLGNIRQVTATMMTIRNGLTNLKR